MKITKKLSVFTLILCLLISSVGTLSVFAKEKDYFPEISSSITSYDELSHELIDMKLVDKLVADTYSLLEATSLDEKAVTANFNELIAYYKECSYRSCRIYNDTIINPLNTEAAEKYNQCNQDIYEIDTYLLELGRKIFASPIGDKVKSSLDASAVEYIEESEILTEEQKKLLNEVDALTAEYNSLCNTEFTYELNGHEYTADDLLTMYNYMMITAEQYREYSGVLAKKYTELMADVYFKLVEARTKLAKEDGYDNFYEYSAENYFYRGSTVKQVDTYKEAIKKYVAPLYSKIVYILNNEPQALYSCDAYYNEEFDLSSFMGEVGTYIKGLSSEMYDTYEYMTDKNLFDLINPGDRVPTTYTITVAENTPFIMNGYSNSYGSLASSLFHEFGHANESRYFDDDIFSGFDYDLAEVHSTSLEILSLPFYENIFGNEVASGIETDLIYYFAYLALYGCVLDELEQHVYIDGVRDMQELCEYYAKLLKEYGLIDVNDPREALYDWTTVSHVFLSPCYYISYALSSTASLEVFALSKTDYDKAVDTYLSICGSGTDMHFEEILTSASLASPFKAKSIKNLAKSLTKVLDLKERITKIQLQAQEDGNIGSEDGMDLSDLKIYKIKSGDTLGKIAAKHKITVEDILMYNDIKDPKIIYAGDILLLPKEAVMEKATYTIQKGDTLYEIAKAFDASMESIAAQNGISDIRKIYAGKVLVFEY